MYWKLAIHAYAKIRLNNVVIRLENKAFKGAHRAERAFNN